jgi:hypothetical protein
MTSSPPHNPYQSPRVVEEGFGRPLAASRAAALKRIRDALCILAIPALWNYGCLFWGSSVGVPHSGQAQAAAVGPGHGLLALANLLFIVGCFLASWFFLLRVLDWVALVLHTWCGGDTTTEDWLKSMYHSLWTLVWASRLGAICWIAWLFFFFYSRGFEPVLTSFFMGTLGHLTGAWVYGTVFFNWYRLRRAAANQSP